MIVCIWQIVTPPKDDADWSKLGLKEGLTLMLVGTPGDLPAEPPQKTIFVEDLSEQELGTLVQVNCRTPHPFP